MQALKITKQIDSDVLHIPELKKWFGKKVEIIFIEVPSDKRQTKGNMKNFISAAGKIDIDENAVEDLREKSMARVSN